MRLPAGDLDEMRRVFVADRDYTVVGCLSFESRCCAVPRQMASGNCKGALLLEVQDPEDAFPDHSAEVRRKIEANRQALEISGIAFASEPYPLLATEDQLLAILARPELNGEMSQTVVLDITSMPKRFFCLMVKRLLNARKTSNLVVTYTYPGRDGYTTEHLAEDSMTCDHLPGFGAPVPTTANTLVVSVGFEALSIRSLLEIYRDRRGATKIITSFPTSISAVRREWHTIMEMVAGQATSVNRQNMRFIAVWDAEQVYETLCAWEGDSHGLTLAPFGPKPHSLGMALFATERDAGLYYTQPKSYNPEYSRGTGSTMAYIVKWDGIACFSRKTHHL